MRDGFGQVRKEFSKVRGEMREEFSKVRSEMREGFAKVRGEINLLRWMIATNGALTLAVFVKIIIH